MPIIKHKVETAVNRSFRVEQVIGMFDIVLKGKLSEEFTAEVPDASEDWQIGAIIGPSGSGKTTIARAAFGKDLQSAYRWPRGKAVVDGFAPKYSSKQITHALCAVGLSSPPSWLKPFAVLSNGEQFRVNLARALLTDSPVVAYDEFTSVVDRNVARVSSAAVSKAIRKGRLAHKFVAVTCHYDILDWLQPDWVLDMASCQLARGCLRQRPPIELTITPIHHSAWVLFRRYHYLNTNLHRASRCFCAFWGDEPVGFTAWLGMGAGGGTFSFVNARREHRTVVLPDYQGVGIGNSLSALIASMWRGLGMRALSTTSHPSMIHHRSQSPLWHRHRLGHVSTDRRPGHLASRSKTKSSIGRITGGFEYVGPPMKSEKARALFGGRAKPFGMDALSRQIDEIVQKYPGATTGLVSRMLGISSTVASNRLAILVEQGTLIRSGRRGYQAAGLWE